MQIVFRERRFIFNSNYSDSSILDLGWSGGRFLEREIIMISSPQMLKRVRIGPVIRKEIYQT